MTAALAKSGHTAEIFVCSRACATVETFEHCGLIVHHIPTPRSFIFRWAFRTERFFLNTPWHGITGYLATAWTLSRALEIRHSETPFDAVQFPNTSACGLFIRKCDSRTRFNRLSSHRMTWFASDEIRSTGAYILGWLERIAAMRAEVVYSPSFFLANVCEDKWGKKVHTVRPPMDAASLPKEAIQPIVPPFVRYLVHFGQIGRRKGSDLLAEALTLAWEQEPGLRMVWAGSPAKPGNFERYASLWGQRRDRVLWLGALPRGEMLSIVRHALATVAPSRADNLPNTVIESLMLGVPVIGTAGASIDEIVEEGLSGTLVPPDDPKRLANAMITAWRGEPSWLGEGFKVPSLISEMTPDAAVQGVLNLRS